MFSEDGPQFSDVYTFVLKENNDFQVVVRHMFDCFFNEHFQAFKIFNVENFSWHVLSSKDITESTVTIRH